MKRGHILLLVALLVSCAKKPASEPKSKEIEKQIDAQLIYGDDHRLENYQASEAYRTLAASTVALVKSSGLVARSGGYQLFGSNYGDSYHLCPSEPYREQTSGAFCSGSLVGPDLVMTAGHCVTSASDCADVRLVFDFAVHSASSGEQRNFTQDEVYRCQQILARQQTSDGADYAILRLDRKVAGRSPLKVRRRGVASVGDPLVVIGHPAGIPQKIAGGASVRSVSSQHFVANLDTYGGNSGSSVFNARTREIEGILVRGDTDFQWTGACSVSNRCADNGCRGEDVTRIDQVLSFIPDSQSGDEEGSPSEQREVFAVERKLSIPDAPRSGVTSSVTATSAPRGRKVLVQVDLAHTYRGDLVLELASPSGKKVVLQRRSGGSLDDLRGIYGEDLQSHESLLSLQSEAKTGKWSLKITDEAAVDVGVLNKWAVIFANP
ncbi:MAG: trypsin-like peptidase domain-containing protein [Pseudobdellovibrionaceae bacterium]